MKKTRFDWDAFQEQYGLCEVPAWAKRLSGPEEAWQVGLARRPKDVFGFVDMAADHKQANETMLGIAPGLELTMDELLDVLDVLPDKRLGSVIRYMWPTFKSFTDCL